MGNYSRPVDEILARLTYHTADVSGRILRGLRFIPTPIVRVDGLDDFPALALFIPKMRETYPTARAQGFMSWNFAVAVKREDGCASELMQWVEKVLDALETKRDGSGLIDTNIGGTMKPFEASIVNAFALDLSVCAELTLSIEPRPSTRGGRRT